MNTVWCRCTLWCPSGVPSPCTRSKRIPTIPNAPDGLGIFVCVASLSEPGDPSGARVNGPSRNVAVCTPGATVVVVVGATVVVVVGAPVVVVVGAPCGRVGAVVVVVGHVLVLWQLFGLAPAPLSNDTMPVTTPPATRRPAVNKAEARADVR